MEDNLVVLGSTSVGDGRDGSKTSGRMDCSGALGSQKGEVLTWEEESDMFTKSS